MRKINFVVVALTSLLFAQSALAKTYKYTYPIACGDLWGAVKDTLSNQANYANVKIDEPKMTAAYSPKHSVHFDVSGVLLQRTNHVTLILKGAGCEMQVVSNYSGWGHEDQGDFKKRVDESLTKPKTEQPTKTDESAAADK
jgi:hypothetical protein